MKNTKLLEEAKLRYPVGTKFRVAHLPNNICVVKNHEEYPYVKDHINFYIVEPMHGCYAGSVYADGKWAEIIDDFVLPEKWCIKQSTHKEVCDWFNKNGTMVANITGNWTYLNYPNISGYYSDKIKPGYTEITFEQFKKYVLKEKDTVVITDSHSDMLKLQSKGINSIVLPPQKVIEKDYEILKFILPNSKITYVKNARNSLEFMLNNFNTYKIHSVKRLSDGEVFTIGDKCKNGIITSFKQVNSGCPLSALYNNGCQHDYIQHLLKIKQPLFTTEDGVDIFDLKKDIIYFVPKKTLSNIFNNQSLGTFCYEPEIEYYFSTKEKAEEYILMNKPCLSFSNIYDNLKVKDREFVLKFIKSKIK